MKSLPLFDMIGFAFALLAMMLIFVWLAGEIATMDNRYFEICEANRIHNEKIAK